MTFEEWAIENYDPKQDAYQLAKSAWKACEQHNVRRKPVVESVRSFCHVQPHVAPILEVPARDTEELRGLEEGCELDTQRLPVAVR